MSLCDCAPIGNWRNATNMEYEYVDDVFIGDVKNINEFETEYEIVICEVFKGDLKVGQKIKGINLKYCSPIVSKKGQWLFFGTYSTDFKINDCGLTTNIDEPWHILPPPPPPNLKEQEKKIIEKWKKVARENVQEQIKILRNKTK